MRERSVKVENSVTEGVQGVLCNILCSWDCIVLLYHCLVFALHVSRRITPELLFSWQNIAPYVSAEDIQRLYITAWALAWLFPPSTEGEKCNLAFTLLQLLCTTKWPSPFVKVLSTWINKCPLLTVCVWSKGCILCENLNWRLTQYYTEKSSLCFFWQLRRIRALETLIGGVAAGMGRS